MNKKLKPLPPSPSESVQSVGDGENRPTQRATPAPAVRPEQALSQAIEEALASTPEKITIRRLRFCIACGDSGCSGVAFNYYDLELKFDHEDKFVGYGDCVPVGQGKHFSPDDGGFSALVNPIHRLRINHEQMRRGLSPTQP